MDHPQRQSLAAMSQRPMSEILDLSGKPVASEKPPWFPLVEAIQKALDEHGKSLPPVVIIGIFQSFSMDLWQNMHFQHLQQQQLFNQALADAQKIKPH